MKADYTQNKEDETIIHVNCDYMIGEVSDFGNGEVLATAKIKNEQGEYVGIIPFTFIYNLHDTVQDKGTRNLEINNQAVVELEKIITM